MISRDLDKAALRGEPSYVWRAGQERRLRMSLSAAQDQLAGRVLENGCGVGMYIEHLLPYSGSMIGLEYDPERAHQAYLRVPQVVIAAGEGLPFERQAFDAILSHEVLEHVRDDKGCIHQERTERKEPAQDRTLQEAERMFNAAGMGASPSLMLAMQQTLASQLPVKPQASIPLAEPQTTRALAGDYFNLLSIRASALQYYVANDHKDRLKLPDSTYAHIASSLNAGKHIILTGPPGCAKTSLAMAICDFVVQHVQKAVPGYVMTTASSDWTTFDTVGGYIPDQSNNLQFRLDLFSSAARRSGGGAGPRAGPLRTGPAGPAPNGFARKPSPHGPGTWSSCTG